MPRHPTSRVLASAARPRTSPVRSAGTSDGAEATASVLEALRALRRALRLVERDAADDLGLPPAQAQVLRSLAAAPAASLAELAERTHTDPSSASVVVQRLVAAGLVTRTPAADDRRRTELALSAAGRARMRRRPGGEQRVADAIARLGARRAAALAGDLALLTSALREPADDD